MRWYGVDTERLFRFAAHLAELEHAIVAIGPVNDVHGDRMRDEARRLAAEGAATARSVFVEFERGSWAAHQHDRWGDEFAGWWVERHVFEHTEVDQLLRELLDHPERAGVFVDRLTTPDALIHGVNDFDALERFWRMVTDPATVPPEIAMPRIRTLLRGLFAERYWENVPATRIEDPTMKTRNKLMIAALATSLAAWQLNVPGMLGAIGSTDPEGRKFVEQMVAEETIAAEMRLALPEVFERTLENFPKVKPDQALFIGGLGFAAGALLTNMASWTPDEMARNLQIVREAADVFALIPSPYGLTTLPSLATTLVMPARMRTSPLTDGELLQLNQLRITLANATANALLDLEIAAGNHVRGSKHYSAELLFDLIAIRWAFDSPFLRGGIWMNLSEYFDIEALKGAALHDPTRVSETLHRHDIAQPHR